MIKVTTQDRYLNDPVVREYKDMDEVLKKYEVFDYIIKPYINDIETGKVVDIDYDFDTKMTIQKE
jgi:hypothetical protein